MGKDIGSADVANIILRPGHQNNFTMSANIDQGPVVSALGDKPYCETGILPFELRGKNVTNHGQHLSYYADALAASSQIVNIDIATPLDKIGLDIPCSK